VLINKIAMVAADGGGKSKTRDLGSAKGHSIRAGENGYPRNNDEEKEQQNTSPRHPMISTRGIPALFTR